MTSSLRPAVPADAAEICRIYNHYILNTTISFEEEAVSENEMAGRISELTQSLPWLVLVEAGRIAGYAYASKWKARGAYRYSVESSVYLAVDLRGGGRGTRLYGALIDEVRKRGLHAIIGGVAQPNEASVALHEKFGFKKVAHFEQVGKKFNRWVDVAYWQLLLE